MNFKLGLPLFAMALVCALPLPAQKKPVSKTIRFQGAPQYPAQDLLAAAGFKSDAPVKPGEVRAHARLLNDTGLFDAIRFATDSKGLLFTLTPARQLYPLHFDNLPLTPGPELEAQLRARFPLYRGQLPGSGSLLEAVRKYFQESLAARGVQAAVKAELTSGLGPQKITAIDFTIASPMVRIGAVRFSGVSAPMQAKAALMADGQSGNPFDTGNSALGLRRTYEDLYQDLGYAAVKVDVARLDPPLVSAQSIDIPFQVTIQEGGIYKLGVLSYPAGALIPRAEVDKVLAKEPPSAARPLDLFVLGVRDAYHAKGYMDCAVTPRPSFDESTRIVNYSLEIAPGDPYQFATVKFDGVPAPMAAKLKLAWKLAPGAAFDESYANGFLALAQKKDKPLAKWLQTVVVTSDFKSDAATHQVACAYHFAKAAPSAR